MKYSTLMTTFLVATMSSATQANDWKSMPGSACKTYFGSQTSRASSWWSGAKRVSADNTWLDCPLVRDNMGSTTSSSTSNRIGRLYVTKWHQGSHSSRCYLRSYSYSGNSGTVNTITTSTGSGYRSAATSSSVPGKSYGHASLACLMPKAQDRIEGYTWYETNKGDAF